MLLTSCMQIISLPPTRIIIDSVNVQTIYDPYKYGEDTMVIYYNRILLKGHVMYMGFIERKGLKKMGDTAIIIKRWKKVKIIK
jgi:hypothetical protein